MLTYIQTRTLLILALCGLVVTLSPASGATTDDTIKASRQLRKTTERTLGDVNKYVSQLDETERALSQVSKAADGNLRKRYESFSSALGDLEKAQARTTAEIGKMRSDGMDYFSAWDKSNARISDPDLRQAAARRRWKVMESHRELADALSEIRLELQPFMSDLRDLNAFLGADLSTTNVVRAGEMIRASENDANALRDRIASVQVTLKQFLTETSE